MGVEPVKSKYTGAITRIITVYDWLKPTRDKTTFKSTQESFHGARDRQEVRFQAKICEQYIS